MNQQSSNDNSLVSALRRKSRAIVTMMMSLRAILGFARPQSKSVLSNQQQLPNEDHFARHCYGKAGKHFSDENDGYHTPPWLHGRVFQPRPGEARVSVDWIERVPDTFERQLQRVRDELIASERKVRNSHQLAIVNVGLAREIAAGLDRNLHVFFAPDEVNRLPSHSEIDGILPEDEILQQRLADAAQIEPVFPGA